MNAVVQLVMPCEENTTQQPGYNAIALPRSVCLVSQRNSFAGRFDLLCATSIQDPWCAQSIAVARRVVTDQLRKIGDERKRLMAALHSFVLEQPGGAGFSTAVDQSDALKSNLENEAVLQQDFHIVFTCKVGGLRGVNNLLRCSLLGNSMSVLLAEIDMLSACYELPPWARQRQ